MEPPLINTISLLLRIYQPCNLLWAEAKGVCTNPLIRFTPIRGLAVGFVIAYGLLTHLIRGGPFATLIRILETGLSIIAILLNLWKELMLLDGVS